MTTQQTLTAQQIADHLEARLVGDPEVTVSAVAVIEQATASHLTYLGDVKKASRLNASETQLVLAPLDIETSISKKIDGVTFILVPEPEIAFLEIAGVFQPRRSPVGTGHAATATIAPTATIGDETYIGHHVVIGDDVAIGRGCRIEHGVVIEAGCSIGDNVVIHPNCVLYSDVIIGNDVILHAGCVIGADGFGYRTVDGRHERLPHYGIVRICNDVEVGACTTIDRAKVGETVIGTGSRIDNLVMIGHNCRIGPHNLIVSQVGFAGSVSTGSYVVCAGQAGIADHVHLGDGAIIGAKTGVHRDMKGGQAYFGTPAIPHVEAARNMMALRRLPEIRSSVKQLEKDVARLHEQVLSTFVTSTSPSPSDIDQESQAA